MGGVVLGILVWQEGGDYVVLLIVLGALALAAFARRLVRRHRDGKVTVLDPDLFRLAHFRLGISAQTLQNITLGGAMIALPIFLQIKLEYNAMQTGLSLAPLSLTMFAMAILVGKRAGHRRSASSHPDRVRGTGSLRQDAQACESVSWGRKAVDLAFLDHGELVP